MPGPWISVYEPLMGTSVEVRIWAQRQEQAKLAEDAVVAEIQRLTSTFTVFDRGSELCRWRRGEHDGVSDELAECLQHAERWFTVTGGAFHPACAALGRRWAHAVETGAPPAPQELTELAAELAALPFHVERRGGSWRVTRLGDCRGVDLNAIAKGYIVDRAVSRAQAMPGVSATLVNAGGDLRHAGPGGITVRIEDPSRPYDNAEPLTRVVVGSAALATSGTAHRGFRVLDRWFGHVLDPRSGIPVRHTVSASVIAADTVTADALATAALVLTPGEAVALGESLGDVAVLVVAEDGTVRRCRHWPS